MNTGQYTALFPECYADLETSKKLKDNGFNWPCREYYSENDSIGGKYTSLMSDEEWAQNTENNTPGFICSAPTLDKAARWLREEHGISIDVITDWEWARDPMTMPQAELEAQDVSEFAGYHYEMHQLSPHRLLYDSPVISNDHAETEAAAIAKALELISDGSEQQQTV